GVALAMLMFGAALAVSWRRPAPPARGWLRVAAGALAPRAVIRRGHRTQTGRNPPPGGRGGLPPRGGGRLHLPAGGAAAAGRRARSRRRGSRASRVFLPTAASGPSVRSR